MNDELATILALAEPDEVGADVAEAYATVLLRVMQTDPGSNSVYGNILRGEAKDFTAAVIYAEFSGSPVILRYGNMKNMAKRAKAGALLEKILGTLKAIGKSRDPARGAYSAASGQGCSIASRGRRSRPSHDASHRHVGVRRRARVGDSEEKVGGTTLKPR